MYLPCIKIIMTKLTSDDVKKIAKLVKLDVSGQEETFAQMFSATLDYIKMLDELDTANVTETYQVTGLTNVFQSDATGVQTLSPVEALKNAGSAVNNLFETKGV